MPGDGRDDDPTASDRGDGHDAADRGDDDGDGDRGRDDRGGDGRGDGDRGGDDAARGSFVDVGGRAHYREWDGPTGTTFVCVHPIGKDGRVWSGPAPLLARHGRVVAPDLPGHGDTEARPGGGLEALGRFVADVARATASGQVVLIGESLGGAAAALAAPALPADALVLLSSYYPPFYAGWRAPAVVAGLILTRVGEGGWSLQRRLLGGSGREGSAETSAVVDRGLVTRTKLALVGASMTPRRTRRRFAAVDCPVMVLHGDLDHEVPVGWARRYAESQPRCETRMLGEVGHLGRLENPRWWTDDVLAWLDGVLGEDGPAA